MKDAKRHAGVVFRGTITKFHDANGYPIAVFEVSRVWKGKVGETFEMPALNENYGCVGFPMKLTIGSELLVFAHRMIPKDPEYFPEPCQTYLMKRAPNIAALGLGRKPRSKN